MHVLWKAEAFYNTYMPVMQKSAEERRGGYFNSALNGGG